MKQTWPFKDMDSRPTRGRFFPISFSEAVQETNEYHIIGSDEKRVRICLLNRNDDDTAALLFAEYRPERALIFYSWPDNIAALSARKAVLCSFPIFAPFRRIRVPDGQVNFAGCYLLRGSKEGELRLTECKVHFRQGRYGGGQSFCSAFKRRVTRIDEKTLRIPDTIETNSDLLMSTVQLAV